MNEGLLVYMLWVIVSASKSEDVVCVYRTVHVCVCDKYINKYRRGERQRQSETRCSEEREKEAMQREERKIRQR